MNSKGMNPFFTKLTDPVEGAINSVSCDKVRYFPYLDVED